MPWKLSILRPQSQPSLRSTLRGPSYFREVPWRWSDVLIAFAPIIVDRLRRFSPFAGPPWFRFALYYFSFVWMLVFPLIVGRRRLGRWPRPPAPRVLFIETLVALPAAVVLFINFNLLPQFLLWLFGEPDIPPNPFEPIIRSPAQVRGVELHDPGYTVRSGRGGISFPRPALQCAPAKTSRHRGHATAGPRLRLLPPIWRLFLV